jgi:hypothetical protein
MRDHISFGGGAHLVLCLTSNAARFTRRLIFALLAFCALESFLPARAIAAEPSDNLLQGMAPMRAEGVRRSARLTDGTIGQEGSSWKIDLAASFSNTKSYVIYDLGRELEIVAAYLQGDNNDAYDISTSRDGQTFELVWRAKVEQGVGLRPRASSDLRAVGRFLRIQPSSGDGQFGVTEIQVFSALPGIFPPALTEAKGVPLEKRLRDKTLLFGLSLLVPLLLPRKAPALLWLLAFAPPLAGAVHFAMAIADTWPVESREISLIRGVIASVGAAAIAREVFAPTTFAPKRPVVLGALGLCGALALLAFYNLGQPQFYSVGAGKPTFAHLLDLRQYYPTAKYFRELGFRRTYEADAAAYIADNNMIDVESLNATPMRDLHTLNLSTVGAQRSRIDAIKGRFSEKRWDAYRQDARWFRNAMGTSHYLETMQDFGGNATPFWIGVTWVLFNVFSPSLQAFTITGAIDLVLLLGMFWATLRCFGPRTALVSMIIFGANDFMMYGSNWSGATLRHDWLAFIGLGICAFKRDKWMLGGTLLGISTMIRAFPALCLVGACLPALSREFALALSTRKVPTLRAILVRERPAMRIVAGAALAAVLAFLVSLAAGPPSAWIEWLQKVSQLDADPHPACVAVKNLIAGWENQGRGLGGRWPLLVTAILFYTGAVVFVSRGRRPEQSALIALVLVPVLFYPVCYYLHYVFLLALLAREATGDTAHEHPVTTTDAAIWLVLLGLCAAQYFTVMVTDMALHYYFATVLLFAAFTAILLLLMRPNVPDGSGAHAGSIEPA